MTATPSNVSDPEVISMPISDADFAALRLQVDTISVIVTGSHEPRIDALEPLTVTSNDVGTYADPPVINQTFFVGADLIASKDVVLPAFRIDVRQGTNAFTVTPYSETWTNVALTRDVELRRTGTCLVNVGGNIDVTPQWQEPGSDLWVSGPTRMFTITGSPTPPAVPVELTLTPIAGGIEADWVFTLPSGKTLSNFTVGRDGTDNTGYGAWSTTDGAAVRERTFDKLLTSQTYTITVRANYSDGTSYTANVQASPLAATGTPPSITATATPGDQQITLAWSVLAQGSSPITGFTVNRSGGSPVSKAATDVSHVFTGLTNGTPYDVTVQAHSGAGNSSVITRSATPTSTPPVGRPVPLVSKRVGGSQLDFNNVIFQGGSPSMSAANSFVASRGGRPIDGFLTFPSRASWGDFRSGYGDGKSLLDAGGLLIWSMPHAPTSEGDAMNDRGANNAYAAEQRALGAWWAANGFNTPRFIVRLDWEFNGDWYNWSANRSGGAAALKQAIINFIDNVRAGGATQVTFEMCANKGPSQSVSHFPQVWPGSDRVKLVTIDQYDQWQEATNSTEWATEMSSVRFPNAAYVRSFAAANGIMWGWAEGGNAHPADGNHGGDNPYYWQAKWDFLMEDTSRLAYDNTYLHPGAPTSLKHDFASNPNSWNVYKAATRWGA